MSATTTLKSLRYERSRTAVFGISKKHHHVLPGTWPGLGRNGVARNAVKDVTKDRIRVLLSADDDEEDYRALQRVPEASEDAHADVLHVTAPEAMGKVAKKQPVLSGSIKGMVMLNIGALLFGSNMVVIKWVEEMMTPEALNALRFGTAALCFLPWLPGALRNPKMLKPALELGVWLAAGYTAQAYGLSQTSAAHGAFTGTFTVLAVPILVGLSGRRIANRTWFAACAGLAGVSLLTTSGGDPNWGDLWCVLSATLFGVHKWRSETVTTDFSASTTELVAAQLFVLAAATSCLAVPEFADFVATSGWGGVVQASASMPWLALLFMGVGTTALTLWIEMDALKEVSAPLAALIYTAEPLWGASFAWVLLDERWGAQGWVGAAMILGASLLSQLGGDPAEKAHGHAEALQGSPLSDDGKIRAHYEDV